MPNINPPGRKSVPSSTPSITNYQAARCAPGGMETQWHNFSNSLTMPLCIRSK